MFYVFLIENEMLIGSFDNGDPNTTNLYIGNINPKVRKRIKYDSTQDFVSSNIQVLSQVTV